MQRCRANLKWNRKVDGHMRDKELGDVLRVLDKLYLAASSTIIFYEALNNTINSASVASVDTVADPAPGALLIEFCRSIQQDTADGNATRSNTKILQHRIAIAAFENEIIAKYGGIDGITTDWPAASDLRSGRAQ